MRTGFGDGSQSQVSINTVPPPNQSEEQLQTIVRTFKKLPDDELEKYEIDLSDEKVEIGSSRAANLLKAWKTRQEELKEAMKSVMKPAEMMANITQQLKTHGKLLFPSSDAIRGTDEVENIKETVLQLLIDLESFLADVDNARDFHTIGAWPTLLGFLDQSLPLSVRTKAVWAVGTAMKNSYDYQLWILEKSESLITNGKTTTGMEMLLEMFQESSMMSNDQLHRREEREERIEFQKRVLYALSSALRGNLDIQETILNHHSSSFYSMLERFLSFSSAVNATDISVMRKVYSLMSDLLEERQYIRYELPLLSSASEQQAKKEVKESFEVKIQDDGNSIIDLKAGNNNDNSSSSSSPGEADISELLGQSEKRKQHQQQIIEYLANLHLLGDYFFSLSSKEAEGEDWSVSLLYHLQHYYLRLKQIHQKYQHPEEGRRETSERERKKQEKYDFERMEERNNWINIHSAVENIFIIYKSYFEQFLKEISLSSSSSSSSSSSAVVVLPSLLEKNSEFSLLFHRILQEIPQTFSNVSFYDELIEKVNNISQLVQEFYPTEKSL
jgi:hypothetical protein